MCLFTAPGSFHETLGGHSHGLEVGLSELQENTCKEQSVSITNGHLLFVMGT